MARSGAAVDETASIRRGMDAGLDRRLWQIGTGNEARPYFDRMLEDQVALLGSGTGGPWPDAYRTDRAIKPFAQTAQIGDLVVARQGLRRALGIGVMGGYGWSQAFSDVEGWDLQHFRPTRWLVTEERHFQRNVFARQRFCRSHDPEVLAWVSERIADADLTPPEALDDLVGEPELNVDSLDADLRQVIERARDWHLMTWGGQFGAVPTEAELIAHVTVPLLEALGWPRERVAIGWHFTDVALFSEVGREPGACRVVFECKRIGSGLAFARDQADGYVRRRNLRDPDVVVTDGVRYQLFKRRNDGYEHGGYANLVSPRARANELFDRLRRLSGRMNTP